MTNEEKIAILEKENEFLYSTVLLSNVTFVAMRVTLKLGELDQLKNFIDNVSEECSNCTDEIDRQRKERGARTGEKSDNECSPFLCNKCKGRLTRLDEKYMFCPKCNKAYNELEIYEFEDEKT